MTHPKNNTIHLFFVTSAHLEFLLYHSLSVSMYTMVMVCSSASTLIAMAHLQKSHYRPLLVTPVIWSPFFYIWAASHFWWRQLTWSFFYISHSVYVCIPWLWFLLVCFHSDCHGSPQKSHHWPLLVTSALIRSSLFFYTSAASLCMYTMVVPLRQPWPTPSGGIDVDDPHINQSRGGHKSCHNETRCAGVIALACGGKNNRGCWSIAMAVHVHKSCPQRPAVAKLCSLPVTWIVPGSVANEVTVPAVTHVMVSVEVKVLMTPINLW